MASRHLRQVIPNERFPDFNKFIFCGKIKQTLLSSLNLKDEKRTACLNGFRLAGPKI